MCIVYSILQYEVFRSHHLSKTQVVKRKKETDVGMDEESINKGCFYAKETIYAFVPLSVCLSVSLAAVYV